MFSKHREAGGIDTPSLLDGPAFGAQNYASDELIARAGVVRRRLPTRRARRRSAFPWRELAWSALAGALAAVLAVLALLWSGWTI